jgi:superfamily I DNA and/or RNA helicase
MDNVEESELTSTPVMFCDTAGGDWEEEPEPEGESRRNPQEAEWVLAKVSELVQLGVDPKNIAVISPYAAQVKLMRLRSTMPGLEIGTVDGFQGREKEVVIITTVRSNSKGEIGFLGDIRRMNVALTRARRKLIVIGDSSTLALHPFFKALIDYSESIDSYTTIWNS